jgi:hypothetical protein
VNPRQIRARTFTAMTSKETDRMANRAARSAFSRPRNRRIGLALLSTLASLAAIAPGANAASELSLESFTAGAQNEDGTAFTQAGKAPWQLRTAFHFTEIEGQAGNQVPGGNLRSSTVELPAGAVGNAAQFPQCRPEQLERTGGPLCPTDSQVGIAEIDTTLFGRQTQTVPVFNMVPPPGMPAQLGFIVIATVAHLDINVRTGGDYGVTAKVSGINAVSGVYGVDVQIWGVPADKGHDFQRFPPGEGSQGGIPIPSTAQPRAFLRTPTSCQSGQSINLEVTSWQQPEEIVKASAPQPQLSGCAGLPFAPTMSVAPESGQAGSPTGFGIDLSLPQSELPADTATSDLKKVVMTLPKGVAINSSSADGLASCDDSAFAIYAQGKDACPPASRIGDVSITSPLLKAPMGGSIFLATPLAQNAQAAAEGKMYRLFLEGEGSGARIKLEGKVVADPSTGQLVTTFDNNPQLPFEKLHVGLNGGPRSPLTTPKACGTYTTTAELTPWARPTEPVTAKSSFTINENCAAAGQFTPDLEAGTTSPVAGKSSPFTLRITQPSGQQNLQRIEATLPEGVLAKLAGVPLCPEAFTASGACPAASQVGTTTVGAGAGSSPIYVPQPGRPPTAVYLAGPYNGAPYSLVVKVPAQAGPFDLGTVTVRNALYVNPSTAQVTAKSDPLPQILLGVPVSYRDVRVDIDRPDFTLNPTSCEPMKVTSALTSIEGAVASPSDRFQVAGCGELGFEPKLSFSLKGQTKRSGHPALTAVLTQPANGQANIDRVSVILPRAQFIDQGRIGNVCTRPQFAAGNCPANSILGTATAYTPLLDKPLRGKVYLRANGGERELPDMVAALRGQIDIDLVGYIDAVVDPKNPEISRIRNRFALVPDAPVSKFVLKLNSGKRALLENSANLCKSPQKASVKMDGQNGKAYDTIPLVKNDCGKSKAKKHTRSGR